MLPLHSGTEIYYDDKDMVWKKNMQKNPIPIWIISIWANQLVPGKSDATFELWASKGLQTI